MTLEEEIQEAFSDYVREITNDPEKVKKIAQVLFLYRSTHGLSEESVSQCLEDALRQRFFNGVKKAYEKLSNE